MDLNYCYGCMAMLPQGVLVCPNCGYDNAYRHNGSLFLGEGKILNGKYLVGRMLGQGGFGITYLGVDLDRNEKVAIKEYFPKSLCSRNAYSKNVRINGDSNGEEVFLKGMISFQNEAQMLHMINSPLIAHVRDYFQENNTAYIVMDFVDGVDLDQVIETEGRLPWQRVIYLMLGLMTEIDKIHKKNLIHRDIKPANLKLVTDRSSGRDHLVLLDFGSARSFISADTTGRYTSILTHGYAPLEQYQMISHQGPYTDVYALCATMYKAITGSTLPHVLNMVGGMKKIEPFSSYGLSVPYDIENVIRHGLALKSEDRPQSMADLYNEFCAALSRIRGNAARNTEVNDRRENSKTVEYNNSSPEEQYKAAKNAMKLGSPSDYENALRLFRMIPGWKDADILAEECETRLKRNRRQKGGQENSRQKDVSISRDQNSISRSAGNDVISSFSDEEETDGKWSPGSVFWFIIVILCQWPLFIEYMIKWTGKAGSTYQQTALYFGASALAVTIAYLFLIFKKAKAALVLIIIFALINLLYSYLYGSSVLALINLIGPVVTFVISRKKVR